MTGRRPSPLTVLQLGTLLQAAVLVPVALAWLWVPVRELRSYRSSTAHDPTADLGLWVVPILLVITALCVLAAAACLAPALGLPLCARRLARRGPFRTLVALESVAWLAPLLRSDVPRTPHPLVLSVLLLAVGAVVVALAAHPANRRLRLVSPDVATHVPDPHRATGHPPTRRH